MDFAYSDEQRMLVDTVRAFVAKELMPHEAEVERDNQVRPELIAEIREKAKAAGLYAANMPEDPAAAGSTRSASP
jgi:acyl-CoA dehydrogenase